MAQDGFRLQTLFLNRRPGYGDRPNDFDGYICFKDGQSEIKIAVDEALSQEVLRLVANNMALATKKLADNMTASIFDQALLSQLTENIEAPVANVTTSADNPDDDLPF